MNSTLQPGRLLLVDDEENVLRALKRAFQRTDWTVLTASDAAGALATLEQFHPEVVISDLGMPGMDGVEFLAQVKQRAPRTQRILLTGTPNAELIEDALRRSEIFRFVTKPWNEQQLLLTVRSAFEQFNLQAENERLYKLTEQQNDELRRLGADLEMRVELRTRQLQLAKREWERIFDSIDFPLAVVDGESYRVKRANIAYARTAGRAIQEVAGRPRCHEYLFGRSEPCNGCALRTALQRGDEGRAEISHGGRTYTLAVYPVMEEGQAVCSYRDVTEDRSMTRRLVDSEKMAAVGQLAGGVAHEVNNPLGGILAFAQLMKRDPGRSQPDLESLALIEESALRCKRIVESLLRFARQSRHDDRRSFGLARCVEDAVLLFRPTFKGAPKAKLELNMAETLPEVFGDPAQLAQVVLNLLQNGLQALPESGGTLAVATGQMGDQCFIRVSDTGCGIKPEHLPRIFEPHFTTKAPGAGTGLGLAIAYRIVEDHGGTFDVQTEVGRGSTFTVFIPIPPAGLT